MIDQPERLLTIRQVRDMCALGASTIYRRMNAGTFPRPVSLGDSTVRWRLSSINAWMNALEVADPAPSRGRPLKQPPAHSGAGNNVSNAGKSGGMSTR
jgi:prophage regulatory protein